MFPALGDAHYLMIWDRPWAHSRLLHFSTSVSCWSRFTVHAAKTATMGALVLASLVRPAAAQDTIRDQIAVELRHKGQLDDLRKEWAEGSLEQRLAIAEARGDLAGALKLLDEGGILPEARALWLEAVGETAQALVAVREIMPAKQGMERAQWSLREAELCYALGEKDEALAAWRRSVVEAASPEFAYVIGHLVGGYGFYDFALEHHDPEGRNGKAAMRAYLRRAVWQRSAARVDAAHRELEKAYSEAPLKRDRHFVLTRIVELMRQDNRLDELITGWRAREDNDAIRQRALLGVLREQGRGQDALELLAKLDTENDKTLTREALSVAVEAGESELAVTMGRDQLAKDGSDVRLRIALSLLLTDLRKREEAIATLKAGMRLERRKDLLLLMNAASELALEDAFEHGLETLRGSTEEKDRLQAVLAGAAHQKSRQQSKQAVRLLMVARSKFGSPQSRVRLAEALESNGHAAEAISIYRAVFRRTGTEDLGMRLAWLLANSKNKQDKAEAYEVFRKVWLSAGSPARRVQAEERVLDLASRNGTLADLAIELEESLEAGTDHADAKREALVKIYARAQDTFAAAEILKNYAKESGNEVEAWQKLANIYLENEEFRRNEKALRHLLTIDAENDLDYRQQLALNALERGRMVEARQIIEEMFDGGRIPSPVAFEFAAGIYTLASRHRDAARLYRRALAIHPDRIETLLLWANSMAGQDKADLAIGRFCILVTQEVRDDLFLVALDGMLNLNAGKAALRFAERAVRRRIAQKPDKVYLHRMLQDILEALGDDEARVRSLEDTLLVAGQQRTAWLRELMEEASTRRDWPTYLGHGRALLASGDEVPPQVFFDLGEALLKTKDLRAAELAFGRARFAPDFVAIERRVASLYEQMGFVADAERVWRRILRRDPENPSSIFAVAKLAERRGGLAEALSLYQEVNLELFDGADFSAKNASNRSRLPFNRNRNTTTGPTWEQTLSGILRCSETADDLATIRARILERLEAEKKPSTTDRLGLLERLRRIAVAWNDVTDLTKVRELEDSLLADAQSSDQTRAAIFAIRLQDGDLDGAQKAIGSGPTASSNELELALRRGDTERVLALALSGKDLLRGIKALNVLGDAAGARTLLARLETEAKGDTRIATFVSQAKRALGIEVDERAALDARLKQALTGNPTDFRRRWGQINMALRAHKLLSPEEKADIFRQVLPDALKQKDANMMFGFLSAAKSTLTDEELAPLVVRVVESISRPLYISSRAPYLRMLPTAQAAQLMQKVLGKLSDSDRRTQGLRLLANKTFPKHLHLVVAQALDLQKLAPSDSRSLIIICNTAELEPEAAAVILAKLEKHQPKDPRTTILAARLATDPALKMSILIDAGRRLAQMDSYDYYVQQAVDAITRQADEATRTELLKVEGDSPAFTALRAEILRAKGDVAAAVDLLATLCKKRPEDSLLLNRIRPLLKALGRTDQLLELTLANAEHSPRTYPHQAGQLARQLLNVGRAEDALAALHKSVDENGVNLRILLRVVAELDDPKLRAQEARLWLQERQRLLAKYDSRMIRVFSMIRTGGPRIQPSDLSKSLTDRGSMSATPEATETSGRTEDLLAFFPEGRTIAETLRRCLNSAQRDANPGLYRALLASARLTGEHDAIIADARAVLKTRPMDTESLRILFAAAQIDMHVTRDELERAIRPHLLKQSLQPEQLIDILITTNHQGHTELTRCIAIQLFATRTNLMRFQMREELGTVLTIAARVAPDLLWRILPDSDLLNSFLDGDIIAALGSIQLTDDENRIAHQSRIRDAFAQTIPYLERRSPHHYGMRLALPYAGLQLQVGDLDQAKRALATDDPQLEQSDTFGAYILAAAIPPLDTWQQPALIDEFTTWLTGQIPQGSPGRQLLFARLAVLCAMRLDQHGDTQKASALMDRIRTLARGIADARPWLEAL